MSKKLYVASPYGFSEAGEYFLYYKFIPIIVESGFIVIDPWKLTDPKMIERANKMPPGEEKRQTLSELNKLIFLKNIQGINESNGLVAVLDGTDVDSGVACEIGYASGIGKKILGYRGDFRRTGENEGSLVNLQVDKAIIELSHGKIITHTSQLRSALKEMFG